MTTPTVAPVINSITFDKPAYKPGDLITVTLSYMNGSSASAQTFTGVAKDMGTGVQGVLTATFTIINPDATQIAVSDTGLRNWTLVSDTGTTAVFTATA